MKVDIFRLGVSLSNPSQNLKFICMGYFLPDLARSSRVLPNLGKAHSRAEIDC
jgi:hypothetical protein